MTSTIHTTPAGLDTWREMVALLCAAITRGNRDAATDPGLYSTALSANCLAAVAVSLLPLRPDPELDAFVLEPATDSMTALELITAAEAATRRHPIEELPRGASEVIVGLITVVRELRP